MIEPLEILAFACFDATFVSPLRPAETIQSAFGQVFSCPLNHDEDCPTRAFTFQTFSIFVFLYPGILHVDFFIAFNQSSGRLPCPASA